jgi:hypothetical protein
MVLQCFFATTGITMVVYNSRFIFTCLSFFFHEITLLRDLFFLIEPRRLMEKFYLKFDTMKLIVKASTCCSLENILTSKWLLNWEPLVHDLSLSQVACLSSLTYLISFHACWLEGYMQETSRLQMVRSNKSNYVGLFSLVRATSSTHESHPAMVMMQTQVQIKENFRHMCLFTIVVLYSYFLFLPWLRWVVFYDCYAYCA